MIRLRCCDQKIRVSTHIGIMLWALLKTQFLRQACFSSSVSIQEHLLTSRRETRNYGTSFSRLKWTTSLYVESLLCFSTIIKNVKTYHYMYTDINSKNLNQ